MKEFSKDTYQFGDFLFDSKKLALYHQKRLIKNVGEKSMQVLTVLLQNGGGVASHEEIIEQVWQDNLQGATPENVAQYISKLRKLFAEYEPDKKFIENVKGRGYMFVGNLTEEIETPVPKSLRPPSEQLFAHNESEQAVAVDKTEDVPSTENHSRRSFIKPAYLFGALLPISLILLSVWFWFPQNDEQEIRRVIEESQKFESMVLYKNPKDFQEAQLAKYWMPDTDFNSEFDMKKVRSGVQRLVKEEKYYGNETKPEQFEFESVEINESKDFAVVKTLEKWFIAEYHLENGTLLKNKTVGPYFVTYTLRKINGKWLIEKSNTARAKPTPTN